MKKHNGGAMTLICDHISSKTTKDYYRSSSSLGLFSTLSVYTTLYFPIDDLVDRISHTVALYQATIQDCIFSNNYSGRKGSALYLK